ncbi:MAG: response regulator [Cyanobacteria bacterium J06634_6]
MDADLRWMSEENERSHLVLVIEDQTAHIDAIEQVLSQSNTAREIVFIHSTQEAIDFLRGQNNHEQPQRPDLILMNIHISAGNGSTLLTEIKSDGALRRIPTILLTNRADTAEILSSYQQQCNCYVIKPQELTRLNEVISVIESFWLNLVTLPTE